MQEVFVNLILKKLSDNATPREIYLARKEILNSNERMKAILEKGDAEPARLKNQVEVIDLTADEDVEMITAVQESICSAEQADMDQALINSQEEMREWYLDQMLNKLEKEVSGNRMDVVEAHQRFNNEVNQVTQLAASRQVTRSAIEDNLSDVVTLPDDGEFDGGWAEFEEAALVEGFIIHESEKIKVARAVSKDTEEQEEDEISDED